MQWSVKAAKAASFFNNQTSFLMIRNHQATEKAEVMTWWSLHGFLPQGGKLIVFVVVSWDVSQWWLQWMLLVVCWWHQHISQKCRPWSFSMWHLVGTRQEMFLCFWSITVTNKFGRRPTFFKDHTNINGQPTQANHEKKKRPQIGSLHLGYWTIAYWWRKLGMQRGSCYPWSIVDLQCLILRNGNFFCDIHQQAITYGKMTPDWEYANLLQPSSLQIFRICAAPCNLLKSLQMCRMFTSERLVELFGGFCCLRKWCRAIASLCQWSLLEGWRVWKIPRWFWVGPSFMLVFLVRTSLMFRIKKPDIWKKFYRVSVQFGAHVWGFVTVWIKM